MLAKLGLYQASLDAGPLHVNPPTLAVPDSHGENPNAAPAGSFLLPMFSSTKIAATNQWYLCD